MNFDVFVSFKSEDRDLAEKICDDLGAKNLNCWISSRGIRGGQNYQEEIVKALLGSSVMVLVFSSAADKSDEIAKELSLASKYKKFVIPVRIEDFKPGMKYEYEMATRQYIDLFDNWEKKIDQLSTDIKSMMSNIAEIGQKVVQQEYDVNNDSKYRDMLTMAYSDGVISPQERNFLIQTANELDITPDHAMELEEQVKKQISTSNVNTSASIAQSETAVDGDVDWPTAGHKFIKAVKMSLDISLFPFKPTYVSDDEQIEEEKSEPEIEWAISDKHYFAIWLSGKRKDKVAVRCGLYSSNEKRDPLIRKTSDDLYEVKELLDQDEDISINGVKYLWNDEGLLGLEANERKLISEINNPDFIKHVVDNLVAFANKAWPVIQKNLLNG